MGKIVTRVFISMVSAVLMALSVRAVAESPLILDLAVPIEVNGFIEMRGGSRLQPDPHEKDISVMESRLQGELFTYTDWAEFKFKGDYVADGITASGKYETREAWVFARPAEFMDIKVGRQVLTWGTGDLVFLNDLFPKDWQSYFIGRDMTYLKAPSDAVKIALFSKIANLDVVYSPQFDPDRFITGEYVSYWNNSLERRAGRYERVVADTPDEWFRDDEIALRVYRNIRNYELALYGYFGFWKRPAGEAASGRAIFPGLNAYGASVRGRVGSGIGNLELAYYVSTDDDGGANPLVNNSEMRYLLGYTQDIARDFTAGLQYYVEQMLNYGAYRASLAGDRPRDRYRHVITLQLTKLLMNQNLELSLATYYSPSDRDAYLRPTILYQYSDYLALEMGGNIFLGEDPHTFFSQFERNTNMNMAMRYSF